MTAVSCSETGTWHVATRYRDTVNGVMTEETWWAVAAVAGSPKITTTNSGSIAATPRIWPLSRSHSRRTRHSEAQPLDELIIPRCFSWSVPNVIFFSPQSVTP